MGKFVVIPELIEYLLFLKLGGKLFLLKPRTASLELQKLLVALLSVLIGFGALALKLKLLIVNFAYLGANIIRLLNKAVAAGIACGELILNRG